MKDAGTLCALVERLARVTHAMQFAAGLNPSQWEALRYLARANRYSSSPTALARYLGITKGTVSQTIIALESKGYLSRERGQPDKRSVRLELTPKGRTLLDNDPLCVVSLAGAGIDEPDRKAMMRGIEQLLGALCRQKGSDGFGACGDCAHLDAKPCSKGTGEDCVCGLANEPLSAEDLDRICVSFRRTA
jgi:DNA-binding MarR family transcriptional regulator